MTLHNPRSLSVTQYDQTPGRVLACASRERPQWLIESDRANLARSAATRYRGRANSHVVALQVAGQFRADHDRHIED
jgi:hypothetical protein